MRVFTVIPSLPPSVDGLSIPFLLLFLFFFVASYIRKTFSFLIVSSFTFVLISLLFCSSLYSRREAIMRVRISVVNMRESSRAAPRKTLYHEFY